MADSIRVVVDVTGEVTFRQGEAKSPHRVFHRHFTGALEFDSEGKTVAREVPDARCKFESGSTTPLPFGSFGCRSHQQGHDHRLCMIRIGSSSTCWERVPLRRAPAITSACPSLPRLHQHRSDQHLTAPAASAVSPAAPRRQPRRRPQRQHAANKTCDTETSRTNETSRSEGDYCRESTERRDTFTRSKPRA